MKLSWFQALQKLVHDAFVRKPVTEADKNEIFDSQIKLGLCVFLFVLLIAIIYSIGRAAWLHL